MHHSLGNFCAHYIYWGENKSSRSGLIFKHGNFPEPMSILTRTSISRRVSICTALHFPLPKQDAGMLPLCDPPAATPTEKLGTCVVDGLWWVQEASLKTIYFIYIGLISNCISSGYILKAVTWFHSCFLAMWKGTSVTLGNTTGDVVRRREANLYLQHQLKILGDTSLWTGDDSNSAS